MQQNLKNKKEAELLDLLLTNLKSEDLLKILLKKMQVKEDLQLPQLIKMFTEASEEISVPLHIFSKNDKPAECLVKYLKENENLSYKEIANLIDRDEKTVWGNYHRAKKKKKFMKSADKYNLPLSIFKDRSYSLLESIVFYLNKVHNLSNKEIAKLLKKSPNSIAVLMKRARDKHEA